MRSVTEAAALRFYWLYFGECRPDFCCAFVVPQRYDALMKRDPSYFSVGTDEVQSAAVSQFRKWRVDTIKYS